MTDNEIIKALKCCIDEHSCYECIYRLGMSAQCMTNLMRDALTLINRQKAEIEKLKTDFQIEASNKLEKEIKTEAIKGFAERLKPLLGFGRYTSYEEIDNLVKEMTEGENG